MEFNAGKKTVLLWQIRAAFISAIFIAVFAVLFLNLKRIIFIVSAAVTAAVCAFAVFFYIPRYFSFFSVFVSQNAIVIKKGVFFKRKYILPQIRFLFAESFSTPLGFLLGLKGAVFGATGTKTLMEEIEGEKTDKIIEILNREIKNEV